MRILVACEESQAVTKELRALGHEAYSCDILPCSGGHPEWHIQGDALVELTKKWDMIIAFPPCTHLAVSGSKYFKQKIADGRQQAAVEFFMAFATADCPKIAIENPVGVMSSKWHKPDQIVNPWQFGHPESKKTCFWLKGLSPLAPTDVLTMPASGHWANQTKDGQNKLIVDGKWIGFNDPRTAKERSKTYPGIAKAMALQWAGPEANLVNKNKEEKTNSMMNKIEKLLDLCIAIAERQLNPVVVAAVAPAVATEAPTEEPKKTRKPRAAKVEEPAAAAVGESVEDQLGMDAPKEMTEEESKTKMEEVTKQFVSLCKNDTPEDGKTRAIKLMREVFKVQKLGELTHPQRIKWIADMEKGILDHK